MSLPTTCGTLDMEHLGFMAFAHDLVGFCLHILPSHRVSCQNERKNMLVFQPTSQFLRQHENHASEVQTKRCKQKRMKRNTALASFQCFCCRRIPRTLSTWPTPTPNPLLIFRTIGFGENQWSPACLDMPPCFDSPQNWHVTDCFYLSKFISN